MHGRQRVERSPEEEAKKQKERESKVAAYQYAMKRIFDKRRKGELDSDMMAITAQVLAANPDILTLWNIRKEAFTRMKVADERDLMDLVTKELDFTELCLKSNPKSYGSWHHRHWLMKKTDFKRVAEELKLCSKYLEYDDRNFHVWDYRRFLLNGCESVTLEQELQFTTDKISSNFSNFSSWHLRSKLLPQLAKNYLEEELELIRNAVFTDPKDQSAWLYHMWLLKSQLIKESPKLTFLEIKKNHVATCFNVPVSIDQVSELNANMPDIKWNNPWCSSRSKLWTSAVDDKIDLFGDFIKSFSNPGSLPMAHCTRFIQFDEYFDEETMPKSTELTKLLQEELAWVLELCELEPDIKWPIRAALDLMRMINFVDYKPKIQEFLQKLKEIDPKRMNFYNDLGSKYTMEWILADKKKWNSEDIDLSELQLTSLYYPERLCYKTKINCSNNILKNPSSISAFLACEELDISNNHIQVDSSLSKIMQELRNLKVLNISGNSGDKATFQKDLFDKVKVVQLHEI